MGTLHEHDDRQQIDLLAQVPVPDIPQGTDIPLEFFTEYIVNTETSPILIELGAGDGAKAEQVRNTIKGMVTTVDINANAVRKAQERGMMGFVADVRRFEIFKGLASLVLLESNPGVYMQGVLCNQQELDWQRVLTTADILTRPEGYVFIADVIQPEVHQTYLAEACGGAGEVQAYVQKWHQRYDANMEACSRLGIPLHYGEFMVAKPGQDKALEWQNADTLVRLFQSDTFERWAHHIPESDIKSYLHQLGLTELRFEPRVWWSRPSGNQQIRNPLPGFVGVWQKGNRFKYHPWYAGGTMEDRDTVKHARKIASRTDPDYVKKWITAFKSNLPDAETYFPTLFEYDTERDS